MFLQSGNLDRLIAAAKKQVFLGYSATLLHSSVSLIPLMVTFMACKQARLMLRVEQYLKTQSETLARMFRAWSYLNRLPLD